MMFPCAELILNSVELIKLGKVSKLTSLTGIMTNVVEYHFKLFQYYSTKFKALKHEAKCKIRRSNSILNF